MFDVFIANEYTNGAWFCYVLSIIFFLIIVLFYTEPKNNENFSIYKKNDIKPDEVNKNFAQFIKMKKCGIKASAS